MYFNYVVKEVVRRKARATTNVLAVAVLVAMPVILGALVTGYTTAIYLPFKNVGADVLVQKSDSGTPVSSAVRLPFGKGLFTAEETDSISAVQHVEAVAKSLVVWQFDKGSFISVQGIEPDSFVGQKLETGIAEGRFLGVNDVGKIVVEKHFAKFYNVNVGDGLKLGDSTFQVIGTVAAEGESQVSSENIFMNLADAQKLLGVEGYSQLYLRLDNLSSEDQVRSQISRVNAKMVVVSGSSISTSLSNMVSIYERFRTLGAALLAIIVALILFQVSATGLIERRREIGIMQAVGWTRRDIGLQVAAEVTLGTVLGCLFGLGASLALVNLLGPVSVQISIPGGLSNDLVTVAAPLEISAATALEFSIFALAVSAIVSFLIAKRVSGMKPSTNMRN